MMKITVLEEIKNACGNGTLTNNDYLDSCNYVLENKNVLEACAQLLLEKEKIHREFGFLLQIVK